MNTLYVDSSTLRAVASCSTLAATRYHLGWTAVEERAPLRAGIAVHEAIATYFRSGDPRAAMATLRETYQEWAEGALPPDDRLGWPNVSAVTQAWLDAHPLAGFPFVVPPTMVEVGAQAQLTDDGVCLCSHLFADHSAGSTRSSLGGAAEALGPAEQDGSRGGTAAYEATASDFTYNRGTGGESTGSGGADRASAKPAAVGVTGLDGSGRLSSPPTPSVPQPCRRCPCPDGTVLIYCGRMDAVARGRDGRWFVLDSKTTGRMDSVWLDTFHTDAQMNGYVWLLQQHLGAPVAGAFINAIELSRLPSDPVRKCTKHAVVYAECGPLHLRSQVVLTERGPEQLAEWRKGALSLARRYRELQRMAPTLADVPQRVRMTGTFHGVCPRCELRAWCRGGRRMDVAEALMEYNPWEPYQRVTAGSEGAAP